MGTERFKSQPILRKEETLKVLVCSSRMDSTG